MTITLFSMRQLSGTSTVIDEDVANLGDTGVGKNPRSLSMADDDAILLCAKTRWNGEVIYLRHAHAIGNLGDITSVGGSRAGDSIASVRVTPFVLKLNVTVVTGNDGTLPGLWSSRDQAMTDIAQMVGDVNDMLDREHALLRLDILDVTFRADEKRYNMQAREWRSLPASWKQNKAVDTVFVDTIDGAVGIGSFPWFGKFCLVSTRRDNAAEIARTLAHELGHFLSLVHVPAGEENANIMTQSATGRPLVDSTLRDEQIRDMHQVLARNLSRQGNRHE